MEGIEKIISDALIIFQREEIKKRYTLESLASLNYSVSSEDLERMKSIVLDTFYPDVDVRKKQMDYFESLRSFTQPLVLIKAFTILAPTIVKHRGHLLEMKDISGAALGIHKMTKIVDDIVISYVKKNVEKSQLISENGFSFSNELYAAAYVCVSHDKRMRVIEKSTELLYLFKKKNLILNLNEMLSDVVDTANKAPALREQMCAINYVGDFVRKTTDFFTKKNSCEIDFYAGILKDVEKRYADSFYAK